MGNPTVNEAALDMLYLWARKEDAKREAGLPSEWDQTLWADATSCGTVCCLAGKAVGVAGGVYEVERTDDELYIEDHGTDIVMTGNAKLPDGRFMTIEAAAREFLGLTKEEARRLFEGSNELADLRTVIRGIKNGYYR